MKNTAYKDMKALYKRMVNLSGNYARAGEAARERATESDSRYVQDIENSYANMCDAQVSTLETLISDAEFAIERQKIWNKRRT